MWQSKVWFCSLHPPILKETNMSAASQKIWLILSDVNIKLYQNINRQCVLYELCMNPSKWPIQNKRQKTKKKTIGNTLAIWRATVIKIPGSPFFASLLSVLHLMFSEAPVNSQHPEEPVESLKCNNQGCWFVVDCYALLLPLIWLPLKWFQQRTWLSASLFNEAHCQQEEKCQALKTPSNLSAWYFSWGTGSQTTLCAFSPVTRPRTWARWLMRSPGCRHKVLILHLVWGKYLINHIGLLFYFQFLF